MWAGEQEIGAGDVLFNQVQQGCIPAGEGRVTLSEALEPDEVLDETDVVGQLTYQDFEQMAHKRAPTRMYEDKFDQVKAKKILDLVKAGNYIFIAAAGARIANKTLYNWMRRGARGEEPFESFLEDINEAQAIAESVAVMNIRKAGETSWQAWAWWLERTRPERYSRRDTFDLKVTLREQVEIIAREKGLPPERMEQMYIEAKKVYRTLDD
jgi:hypothetical protein